MLTFLKRRPARRRVLNERGQGLAWLMFGLALLFLIVLLAKGAR